MKKTLAAFLLLCTMGMTAPSWPSFAKWFADVVAKVCTKVPQPSDSPGAGTYSSSQSVTIADSYGGSTLYICYTTDGTAPWFNGSTCGNGTHYTGAFNVTSTSTLKAIGCATNYSCSSLDSSLYTLNAGGTFTAIQVGNCAISSGAATCSATVGSSFTTAKVHYYACGVPNASFTPATLIQSVNTGETLTPLIASSVGQVQSGTNTQQSSAIVLPGAAAGHASPIVITLNQNASSGGGFCYVAELTPSANSGNIGVDDDNTSVAGAACTSCTAPNLTLSGTGDAICQYEMGASGFTSPSAVSAPYNTNAYLPGSGNGMGFSCAPTPSNGNGPSWTTSSVTPLYSQVAFGWNVSPHSFQMYQGFDAGTAGNTPAASDLAGGVAGWNGCIWEVTASNLLYATAASMPLLNSTGRLGDGSTTASGSGALGLEITGTGAGTTTSQAKCNWQANPSNISSGILAGKYNDTFGQTDSSDFDCYGISSTTDFAADNCYGNGVSRFLGLETAEGNGTAITFTTTTTCGTSAGQGCTAGVQFNGNSVAVSSVTGAVAAGTVTFTGTFTASQWPVGYAFTPTGCTGGTNYNNNLFYVLTSSSATITANATVMPNGGAAPVSSLTVSGSPTTCTITGVHVAFLYNFSGVLQGVSFKAGASSAGLVESLAAGDAASRTLTNTKTIFLDSLQFAPGVATKPSM